MTQAGPAEEIRNISATTLSFVKEIFRGPIAGQRPFDRYLAETGIDLGTFAVGVIKNQLDRCLADRLSRL